MASNTREASVKQRSDSSSSERSSSENWTDYMNIQAKTPPEANSSTVMTEIIDAVDPPVDLLEVQKEIEEKISLCVRDIEESNEIVRGLKEISEEELTLLNIHCEKIVQEYDQKIKELKNKEMEEEEHKCQEREEPTRHELVNKVKVQDEKDKLHDASRTTEEKSEEASEAISKERLVEIHESRIRENLHVQLNITCTLKDEDHRNVLLGDVSFYYLMGGKKPEPKIWKIIYRLHEPFYDSKEQIHQILDWFGLCCDMLYFSDELFDQFYKRVGNPQTFQYIFYKWPQLLLLPELPDLIARIPDDLSYDSIHQMLTNIKDKNGQTHMFFTGEYLPYEKMYHGKRIYELYALLSIQNFQGKTALHVNTSTITFILSDIYTPNQRDAFIKIASLRDNNNQTAIDGIKTDADKKLLTLTQRVWNNEYITDATLDTSVLIIYNTNNRRKADEEAQIISDACKSAYFQFNVETEKDKTEEEIIALIEETADLFIGCFIVIIMSHGSVGTIEDYEGVPIQLSKIEQAMCSDLLEGRPKMLITQCCQSALRNIDDKKPYAPTNDHFCAVMSSVPGQKSSRGVFLGKLADQLVKTKNTSDIFKLVNSITAEMEGEKHPQTPIIMSTLKAKFCPTDDWYSDKRYW